MSTKLAEVGSLQVTSFYGGEKRGVCLQLTPPLGEEHVQLTRLEVEKLATLLRKWLEG